MSEINTWGYSHATDQQRKELATELVEQAIDSLKPDLIDAVTEFLRRPVAPKPLFKFELALLALVRELARILLQLTLNSLEPEEACSVPKDLYFQCGGYRRRSAKTRNANIASRFGVITLWRRGYRSWQAGDGLIFPLEMMLGFTEDVTPALVDFIGRTYADAGESQQNVLATLRSECSVSMGVKRLRACVKQFSDSVSELSQTHQVDALIDALQQAQQSKGNRKPVLSVGRDGITLREYRHRFFEVATAATFSVYDRAGVRLTTIYLAWPPELGQETMDEMMTNLLAELFSRYGGPLPRLAYVSDSGSQEQGYFDHILRRMVHPKTGKRLHWRRVVDYYHVSERVWSMAGALFRSNQEKKANAWARRMLRSLKKPSGGSRVLHSAASLYHRRTLGKSRKETFRKAYRYIQKRTKSMRYAECKSHHIPIGSGVTEAACKTIYTQRLKLSGMRWSFEGAKTVLRLRTVLLSGTWDPIFDAYLDQLASHGVRPYDAGSNKHLQNSA